jgi:heavy metal translocating P-type ATPase
MVFDILYQRPEGPPGDYRATDLYRACVEAGIIPAQQAPEPTSRPSPLPQPRAPSLHDSTPLPPGPDDGPESLERGEELTFHVSGMWCATCAALVESILRATPGIVDARVSFISDSARVRYLPHLAPPGAILDRVSRLGYTAHPCEDEAETARERRRLQLRLGIAAILTANVMMLSWALYIGFFQDLGDDGARLLSWPLWLLSTPVVFYAGAPILTQGIRGLRWGVPSMETLIAVGCLTAYFFSLARMLSGSLHVYFDTASMLVTLVLLGKLTEAAARDKVSRGVRDLLSAAGAKVRVLRGDREIWVAGDAATPGEEFLVREGERVPVDGEVLAGSAELDESHLTGEVKPASRKPPDEILAGALVLRGELRARVLRPARESFIQQMIQVIQEALASKVPAERMADRVMRWIVPSVLILASATGMAIWSAGGAVEEAWRRGLAVLVITCPCALGIAIPLARVATISAGRERGIVVRDPEAFGRARSLNAFVLDKTGTVTEGVFSLRGIAAPDDEEAEVLRRVGAVEARSGHLIAREIVRRCLALGIEPSHCAAFESFNGMGVLGVVDGETVRVGNRRFMAQSGCNLHGEIDDHALGMESHGMTTTFFAWGGTVRGFLWLGDGIKAGSPRAIRSLKSSGARVFLVSGDSVETTRWVGELLETDGHQGAMRPADKAEFVKALQREGLRVGVVGDGINDAPALVQADVAFSVGSGAHLLGDVSTVTLIQGCLSGIEESVALSKLHGRIAAQNLFFAFAYNGLAIPIAMAGLLNPILAVIAMFMSSLTVLANTSRISRSVRCSKPD